MTNRGIDQFRPQSPSSRPPVTDQLVSHPPQALTEQFNGGPGNALEAVPIHHLLVSDPQWDQESPTQPELTSAPDPQVEPLTPEVEQDAELDQSTALPKAAACPPTLRSRQHQIWQTTTTQLAKGARVLGMPLVWVGVIAFCGGTGYAAFSWLSTIPEMPRCDRLWILSSDADRLMCAEQAVRSGDATALVAGLKLINGWAPDHYLSKKTTRLKTDWAKALMAIAQEKALRNQIDEAIHLAQQIPPASPSHPEAKAAVLEWQNSRQQSQEVAKQIATALQAHDWKEAEAILQTLSTKKTAYWRQQQSSLREQIMTERIANNQLWQLRELVKSSPLNHGETLARAIALAQQIEPGTETSTAAQEDIRRWKESLVELAAQRLAQGDQAGAIATAEWIPQDATMPAAIQELVWLHQAQTLNAKSLSSPSDPNQWWQLTSTQAALRAIPASSPLHGQAQQLALLLETKIQDLTQINLATAIASSQQIPTLLLAIQMAQAITPDRPQRLYAQTLIASWKKDIQRAEDRPYFALAQQKAKSKKIPDLQAAIAQASKIPLGRALRPEAQAAIFDWRQQIQTIEDQPTLAQARRLGQQKQLPEAIQTAAKIAAGRALYPEAQRAIQQWTATLQTAEDQPILAQAKALAAQGDPAAAVRVAYQIAPERALYNEAQTAIAGWNEQLASTRRRGADRDRPNPRRRYYDSAESPQPAPDPADLPPT